MSDMSDTRRKMIGQQLEVQQASYRRRRGVNYGNYPFGLHRFPHGGNAAVSALRNPRSGNAPFG